MVKKLSDEERKLFLDSIKGVIPLKPQQKVMPEKPKPSFRKPQREIETIPWNLEDPSARPLLSDSVILFSQPGLDIKVIKKLKYGQFPIEASLDLHGFTSDQAKNYLLKFLDNSLKQGKRLVKIIHGKGSYQLNEPPILKNLVYLWLQQIPEVLAISSALPRHGGLGAVYVLLRAPRR